MEDKLQNYISKLLLLESRLGASVGYEILEPFPLNTESRVQIQQAAGIIAEFIGLKDYRFHIHVGKQRGNIAGHIELHNLGRDVNVHLSSDILRFPEAVLAVLSHELTHKYLHIHGVSLGDPRLNVRENEVLTDMCDVYLGLGKLLLN